jgi:hypothetical protein
MTLEVLFELESAPPYTPTQRDVIMSRLAEIDAQTTKPRTLRELALSNQLTLTWVTKLDAEANTLRTELSTLNTTETV